MMPSLELFNKRYFISWRKHNGLLLAAHRLTSMSRDEGKEE
jgi:hypothetical protein